MAKYADAVNQCVYILAFVFQKPTDIKIGRISGTLYILLITYYYYLTVLLLNEAIDNADIDILAQCMEGFAIYGQLLVKLYPIMIQQSRFRRMLKLIEKFWDSDDFPEISDECTKIYKISYYCQNIFQGLVVAIICLFYLLPILKHELMLALKIPNYPYSYEILLLSQYFGCFLIGVLVSSVDTLFLNFSTHIYVQMKLLGYVIKSLDFQDEDFIYKFHNVMQYHQYVLKFAEELKKMFSHAFLLQFVLSIYFSCSELYIILESPAHIGRIITSLTCLAATIGQLAIICFPANFATHQMSLISSDIYNTNWYEGPAELQKHVIIVLMRTNKPFKITGGDMIDMNIETFTEVFKTSLSFFMLLKQIKVES